MKTIIVFPFFRKPVILLCFAAFGTSLFAQTDTATSVKKIKYSLGLEQGLILNFPGKGTMHSSIHPITTASYFYGLQGNADYGRWFASLSIMRNGYAAGLDYFDDTLRGKGGFYGGGAIMAGDYSVYWHYPVKIGYTLYSKNKKFRFQPYLQIGWLHSRNAGHAFSTTSTDGKPFGPDSLYYFFTISMARPYANALSFGAGFRTRFDYKRVFATADIDYFQSNKIWTSLKGLYFRESNTYGTYTMKNIVNSKAQTGIASITIGYRW